MAIHTRTAQLLIALDEGADTPPQLALKLGLPTASVRRSLFRLRRAGRVDRSNDGKWGTLPVLDSAQILDVLIYFESDCRPWNVVELASCTDLTVGQIIVITELLARQGLIERLSPSAFCIIDPQALDRYV